jgi:dipeptidase E
MPGTIVALGGLSPDHNDDALHRFIIDAANRRKPRICYVPLASGDFERYVGLFYDQYPASICEPRHLELLRSVSEEPAQTLAAQDIIYLGGGSTPVLVASLRILGLDKVLRAVWERGGVLCGDSAGAHIWFNGCITDSLGPGLRVFADGLGIAAGACVAHFDHDRSKILEDALRTGELPGPAWGIEDGAALVLSNGAAEAVGSRDQGGVCRLTVRHDAVEAEPLDVRRL